MSRKPVKRIVRAAANLLRKRDRREMQAVGALLSLMEPARRRRRGPRVATRRKQAGLPCR
jgi:hypothetical protein